MKAVEFIVCVYLIPTYITHKKRTVYFYDELCACVSLFECVGICVYTFKCIFCILLRAFSGLALRDRKWHYVQMSWSIFVIWRINRPRFNQGIFTDWNVVAGEMRSFDKIWYDLRTGVQLNVTRSAVLTRLLFCVFFLFLFFYFFFCFFLRSLTCKLMS